MGTSISHPSLSTLGWRSVKACYNDPRISVDRVTREIWRAAKQTPDVNVIEKLTSQAIYNAFVIAQTASEPIDAHIRCNKMISESKSASIFMEVAKRAVLRSIGQRDRASEFVSQLFREITNYFISRDISGHLGSERIHNVRDIVNLKNNLINKVGEAVGTLERAPNNHKEWSTLVIRIAKKLSR